MGKLIFHVLFYAVVPRAGQKGFFVRQVVFSVCLVKGEGGGGAWGEFKSDFLVGEVRV